MIVSDIPRIPIKKPFIYLIQFIRFIVSKIVSLFPSSSPLNTELKPDEFKLSDSNGEIKTAIFFSITAVVIAQFAIAIFKRQAVGQIPFGDILIEIFENDIDYRPEVKPLKIN